MGEMRRATVRSGEVFSLVAGQVSTLRRNEAHGWSSEAKIGLRRSRSRCLGLKAVQCTKGAEGRGTVRESVLTSREQSRHGRSLARLLYLGQIERVFGKVFTVGETVVE